MSTQEAHLVEPIIEADKENAETSSSGQQVNRRKQNDLPSTGSREALVTDLGPCRDMLLKDLKLYGFISVFKQIKITVMANDEDDGYLFEEHTIREILEAKLGHARDDELVCLKKSAEIGGIAYDALKLLYEDGCYNEFKKFNIVLEFNTNWLQMMIMTDYAMKTDKWGPFKVIPGTLVPGFPKRDPFIQRFTELDEYALELSKLMAKHFVQQAIDTFSNESAASATASLKESLQSDHPYYEKMREGILISRMHLDHPHPNIILDMSTRKQNKIIKELVKLLEGTSKEFLIEDNQTMVYQLYSLDDPRQKSLMLTGRSLHELMVVWAVFRHRSGMGESKETEQSDSEEEEPNSDWAFTDDELENL